MTLNISNSQNLQRGSFPTVSTVDDSFRVIGEIERSLSFGMRPRVLDSEAEMRASTAISIRIVPATVLTPQDLENEIDKIVPGFKLLQCHMIGDRFSEKSLVSIHKWLLDGKQRRADYTALKRLMPLQIRVPNKTLNQAIDNLKLFDTLQQYRYLVSSIEAELPGFAATIEQPCFVGITTSALDKIQTEIEANRRARGFDQASASSSYVGSVGGASEVDPVALMDVYKHLPEACKNQDSKKALRRMFFVINKQEVIAGLEKKIPGFERMFKKFTLEQMKAFDFKKMQEILTSPLNGLGGKAEFRSLTPKGVLQLAALDRELNIGELLDVMPKKSNGNVSRSAGMKSMVGLPVARLDQNQKDLLMGIYDDEISGLDSTIEGFRRFLDECGPEESHFFLKQVSPLFALEIVKSADFDPSDTSELRYLLKSRKFEEFSSAARPIFEAYKDARIEDNYKALLRADALLIRDYLKSMFPDGSSGFARQFDEDIHNPCADLDADDAIKKIIVESSYTRQNDLLDLLSSRCSKAAFAHVKGMVERYTGRCVADLEKINTEVKDSNTIIGSITSNYVLRLGFYLTLQAGVSLAVRGLLDDKLNAKQGEVKPLAHLGLSAAVMTIADSVFHFTPVSILQAKSNRLLSARQEALRALPKKADPDMLRHIKTTNEANRYQYVASWVGTAFNVVASLVVAGVAGYLIDLWVSQDDFIDRNLAGAPGPAPGFAPGFAPGPMG